MNKPTVCTEIEVMGVTVSMDVDYIPADPSTGTPEDYEINGAWIGNHEITGTAMLDEILGDIHEGLSKRRKLANLHRTNGSWRGIPRGGSL